VYSQVIRFPDTHPKYPHYYHPKHPHYYPLPAPQQPDVNVNVNVNVYNQEPEPNYDPLFIDNYIEMMREVQEQKQIQRYEQELKHGLGYQGTGIYTFEEVQSRVKPYKFNKPEKKEFIIKENGKTYKVIQNTFTDQNGRKQTFSHRKLIEDSK